MLPPTMLAAVAKLQDPDGGCQAATCTAAPPRHRQRLKGKAKKSSAGTNTIECFRSKTPDPCGFEIFEDPPPAESGKGVALLSEASVVLKQVVTRSRSTPNVFSTPPQHNREADFMSPRNVNPGNRHMGLREPLRDTSNWKSLVGAHHIDLKGRRCKPTLGVAQTPLRGHRLRPPGQKSRGEEQEEQSRGGSCDDLCGARISCDTNTLTQRLLCGTKIRRE